MSNISATLLQIPAGDIIRGVEIQNIRRGTISPESVDGLASDIRKNGLQSPILVMKIDDEWHLVAGARRMAAIDSIQEGEPFMMDGVPAREWLGDQKGGEFANAKENILRLDVSHNDIAAFLSARVDDGITHGELADEISKKRTYVDEHVLYHRQACDLLKQAVDDSVVSFAAAFMMAKDMDAEQQEAWVNGARRREAKISMSDVDLAKDPDRNKPPGKKKIKAQLARLEAINKSPASDMALAFRWNLGFLTDTEWDEYLSVLENG